METEFETAVEKQDVWEVLEKLLDEVTANRSDAQLWPVMEQLLIEKVLKKTRGNQVQAARILGIHRNTLRNRIERYGLGRNQWDD
ncbi:MAG: helix-turn-helix domain-containing protein [Calditrichia bacterium]